MVAAFILPKALPTSRFPSVFRSIEQHPAGWEKPRLFLNQAQEGEEPGNVCGWPLRCLRLFLGCFRQEGPGRVRMLICLFAKRPHPDPTLVLGLNLLGSSSFESSLCLSCCVFPPDELVQLWPQSQTYHPTKRFEPRPVFLQLVFMELV